MRLSVGGTLAPGAMGQWRAGRAVRVTATLREPTTYRNPGVPDEQRALARRGIALVGSVKSAAMVEVDGAGSRLDEWDVGVPRVGPVGPRRHRRLRGAPDRPASPPRSRSAIARGSPQDDEQRLQAAGTYHVIAISGGNIAILTVLLLGAARWLGASPRVGAAVAIVVLLAYGRITGPAPSVDRAISAAVLFLVGRLLEQRGPSINILAVAATLGLPLSPTAVLDPGFLLSFGATLGILIGVPGCVCRRRCGEPVRHDASRVAARRPSTAGDRRWPGSPARGSPSRRSSRRPSRPRSSLAPIGAALFGRVTCAGLVLNLAAIPLMTVVQAGSLAALGAVARRPRSRPACGYVVHLAARGLVDSARLVDLAPWLSRELAPPAWGVLAAATTARSSWRSCRTRASRARRGLTALLGLADRRRRHMPPRATAWRCRLRGGLRIVFLDVGQGDATLLDAAGRPCAFWSTRAACRPLRSRIPPTVRPSTSASASSRARCAPSACARSTRSC